MSREGGREREGASERERERKGGERRGGIELGSEAAEMGVGGSWLKDVGGIGYSLESYKETPPL